MSKNQKPAAKQQQKKGTLESIGVTIESKEITCKCDTAKDIFKMVPEYDEIVEENAGLKIEIRNYQLGQKIWENTIRDHEKTIDNLNSDVKTLQSMLKRRDESIVSLQGNVEFYRTRPIWDIIKERWFGC